MVKYAVNGIRQIGYSAVFMIEGGCYHKARTVIIMLVNASLMVNAPRCFLQQKRTKDGANAPPPKKRKN